jgi:hypothetical protein
MPSTALLLGQMVHKGLEGHHGASDGSGAILAFAKSLHASPGENPLSDAEIDRIEYCHGVAQAMVAGYAENWASDTTPRAQLLEAPFQVRLPSGDYLTGTIDRLVQLDSGEWWLWEHKTTSDYSQNYFDAAAVSWQVCGYMLGARKLTGEWPRGIIYNTILKSELKQSTKESKEEFHQRVANQYLGRPYKLSGKKQTDAECAEAASKMYARTEIILSKRHLKQFAADTQYMMREIREAAASGNESAFYPNTGHCNRGFMRCGYLDTCAAYENVPNTHWFEQKQEDVIRV